MEQATHLIFVMHYAMHSHTQAQVHVCTYTLHTTTKCMHALCVCGSKVSGSNVEKWGNSQPLLYLSELLVDENGRAIGRRRKVAVGCSPAMVWGEMLLVRLSC